jgi:general secretion pathway protein I|tara:strand:+ start:2053 stop:2445 length:393 start_codon:yes stop_codon:yes gene_type:complete
MRVGRRQRGFTLVEVLVAIVVLAVAGFAVTGRVGNVVNQTYGLERRTVAHWVAENQLHRLRVARRATTDPMPTGKERERVLMSGREWLVETEVSETSYPLLRRVEVRVLVVESGNELGPIDTVIAFFGRY